MGVNISSPSHQAPQFGLNLKWVLKGQEFTHNRYKKREKEINKAMEAFEKRTGSPPAPSHPLSRAKRLLDLKKTILGEFTNYDFGNFIYYDKLNTPFGKLPFRTTFGNPPKGAFIVMAFVGLEAARALRAWNRRWIKDDKGRKIKQDFREFRDVLIRDTWSIGLYIWGLTVANRMFLNRGQKNAGFKLANKNGAPLDFHAHEVNRGFKSVNDGHFRRRTYLANILHGNGEGLIKAAQSNVFFGIPREIFQSVATSSPVVKEKLGKVSDLISQFRLKQRELYKDIQEFIPTKFEKNVDYEARITQIMDAHGEKVFELLDSKNDKPGILRQLDDLQQEIIHDLSKKPNGQLNARRISHLRRQWGDFSNFFVRAAKAKRTGFDAMSFAFILFLIGYLPVQFNEWFTNKEYKKMQADQHKYLGMALTLKNTHHPLHPQRYEEQNYRELAQRFGQNA